MANPLYEQMNRSGNDIMAKFTEFKRNFSGDPRQIVQQMLNNGRISQTQLNSAIQRANQMAHMFGIK